MAFAACYPAVMRDDDVLLRRALFAASGSASTSARVRDAASAAAAATAAVTIVGSSCISGSGCEVLGTFEAAEFLTALCPDSSPESCDLSQCLRLSVSEVKSQRVRVTQTQ
jgi:hypothetical protein